MNKMEFDDQVVRDELTSKRGEGTTSSRGSTRLEPSLYLDPRSKAVLEDDCTATMGSRLWAVHLISLFLFFFGPFGGRSQCRKIVATIQAEVRRKDHARHLL